MCTGFQELTPLSTVHTLYSEISDYLTAYVRGKGWSPEDDLKIKAKILLLKKAMVDYFHGTSDNSLHTLKFHLLGHIKEDLKTFGTRFVLDASPFENFNLSIK